MPILLLLFMKFAIALAALPLMATAPALAGPYVNVETNASYSGSDYQSRDTDLHIGYENSIGSFDWYAQGGKTINATDGVDSESNWSGKVGGSVAATDKLGIYGEVAFSNVFDEDTDNSWGAKLGTKYSF
tara:strand:- start:3598 stop:3987 length:390 start_codon:yes stop_codon:yes gene_type:complete